jgi:N-sulfoglucosamine sulfohydrolase
MRTLRLWLPCLLVALMTTSAMADKRPNILVAISDDQSFPHTSAYGYQAISTPAFDRVAKMGVLFNNAFTPAPGCSPMRAAFLTGRNIWQIENAGTHASSFPKKYEVYQDRIESAGYFIGCTGKAWGPGNWKGDGWDHNPAGPSWGKRRVKSPAGIGSVDYAANFADFLKDRPKNKPFSFWFGANEPHRVFGKGIGIENGLDLSKVVVPKFLPDTPEIRSDILDYCFEIQWFDQHLGRMLDQLEEAGELDNTLVVVTSDNGMAFPRAKANCYEYGIHMPLAVAWPAGAKAGRVVDDPVNLIDVTATIYDVSGTQPPSEHKIAGRSIRNILASAEQGTVDESREAVFCGRERHSSSRFNSLSYPQRCIRSRNFLYIRNFRSERWPAGPPQKYDKAKYDSDGNIVTSTLGPMHGGYHDIDACPSLSFLIGNRDDAKIGHFLNLSVDHRPAEELFDIHEDPACLNNLATDPAFAKVRADLSKRLIGYLKETNDARVTSPNGGDIWETYPRYSGIRWFPTPDWAKQNHDRVPTQEWIEKKRPR